MKKSLRRLQVVNKETQSLLLTFNRFHILFWGFCCWLWVKICLLGKVFQGFEEHLWLLYTFPSKQIHAQSRQWKPLKQQKIIHMETYSKINQGRCPTKKLFLNISQNSQENTCYIISFSIKLWAWGLQLIKVETLAQVLFCKFYEILKDTFFTGHLRVLLIFGRK